MPLEKLDNLVKINKLKVEPPDQKEFEGMIASAKRSLQDANVNGLSEEGKFTLIYGAAHAISLAALDQATFDQWYAWLHEHLD